MSRWFKRRMWIRVVAVVLALALNLGALDGIIRYTVQEFSLGSFTGFLQKAEAKNVEGEKNKNTLPPGVKPKPHKNAAALEAATNHEDAAKRTLRSKTFKIDDNTYKTEVYQDAIHYLDQNGRLADIDNTLVESKEKGFDYENKDNSVKVHFAQKGDADKLGRIQMDRFSIGWAMTDAAEASADTARNTITYSGILDQTDLRYTVDGSRLKEDIILNSLGAPAEFEFKLDLKNLAFRLEQDGSITFYTIKDNKTVWVMPKPYMYDAAGAESQAVGVDVKTSLGKLVVTLTPDRNWLESTQRQYPVVIDPTIQPGPSDGRDTFISSSHPTENYRADHLLYAGTTPYYGNTKSFFYFDQITVPDQAKVTSASFQVFATSGSLKSATVYPIWVDWHWDNTTLTWNWWQTNGKLGSASATASGASQAWWNFDVTGLIQKWVENPANNYGLMLQAGGGSVYKEFASCDHGDTDARPKLVYTYSTEPEPPANPANFKLHIDRKTGLIKADGTAVEDARIFLDSSDGQSFRTNSDSSGKWEKTGMNFAQGKTTTISMYYEYDVERTDSEGNTYTETITSDTTSQDFLIAIFSKGARTKKLAKFYWNDGTKAAQLNLDNEIKTELEMVVGDYVLVLDPMRDMPYTVGPIVKDPDEEYRLREKIRPLYSSGEVVGNSIDAATGNFFALETDLSFEAVGLPIEVIRVLNSQEQEMYRGPLGQNWKFAYDKMLIMYGDGSIEATGGDGGGIFFSPSGAADPDVTERLEKNGDGTYDVITKYETVYHFNTDGMLESITDRNGNSVTLGYDPEGLLTAVTDATGRSVNLSYDDMGRITLAEDPEGNQIEYSYDSGLLSQVSDPNGGITSYEYDTGNAYEITQITDPMDYASVTNTFDSRSRVTKQKDAEGYEISLSYGGSSTNYWDALDNQFTYNFDSQYWVTSIIGPDIDYSLPADDSTVQQPTEPVQSKPQSAQPKRTKYQSLGFRDGEGGGAPALAETPRVKAAAANEPVAVKAETAVTAGFYPKLPLVQYHYDARGNRDRVTDAKGVPTYYQYNSDGNLTAILNADMKGTTYKYDDPANPNSPTEVVDALGNTTRMAYDSSGNMLTFSDSEDHTTIYTYYSSGQVKTVADPADKAISYTYDSYGNLETVTDGRGYVTNYYYDGIGRLKEQIDPRQNHYYYEYDGKGNLTGERTPAGETVNRYNLNNILSGTQDPEGNVTTYRYDKRGLIVQEIDPLQKSRYMGYDGNGNQLWSKDANLNITSSYYDALRHLKKTVEPTGVTTEYYYDPNGNQVAIKDAMGNVTYYQYDKFNRLETVTDPLEQKSQYVYDDLGNTRLYTDTAGTHTEYKYDTLSRVQQIIDPLGKSTLLTYDLSGNRRTVTNAAGQTYTYYYDENNNLAKVVDPDGNTTTFEYDENNNQVAMTDAMGNTTTYQYDRLNRLVGVVDPLNNGSGFTLDKNGNRLSVTDGNKNTTNYRYDAAGRLQFVIDARNNTTEYRYDDASNLRFFIDANKNTTEYRYNSRNLLVENINPLGQKTSYEYDGNGNIKVKTDPNGTGFEYDYDKLNRLLGTYYPDGSYVEYGYNAQGKREWMEDQYGTSWYDYDEVGRLTAVTNQDDKTIEYEYNDLRQKTRVRYPDNKEVSYGYDNLNRLTTVTDRFKKVTSYEYDKAGRRIKTVLPNGVATSYDYNTSNQLTGLTSINANGKQLAQYQYEYDGAGNRTSLTTTVEDGVYSTKYFYDPLNELERVSNPDGTTVLYDYDPVGNRLAMTRTAGDGISTTNYHYDRANQLTRFNVDDGPFTEFRYDNNGNRTAKIEPGNQVTSYTWDYENRLNEVLFHQDKWVGFEYDGDGNRITKLSVMTQPWPENGKGKEKEKGGNGGNDVTPPGKDKAKKQQSDLMYMLLKNDKNNGGGNGGGNSGGGGGGNGGGNSGNKGNSGKDNGSNGKNVDGSKNTDKVKNKDIDKDKRDKKKEEDKVKKGYRKKGKYTNKGKHKGWYKNGKIPTEQQGAKVEIEYYLNDVSDPLTQVLMTYDDKGFNAAYTYGNERIEVEAVDETRPESQDPLYYLYDGLGSVAYMVKPDGNVRDHYRYDEYGKPAPGNSKQSSDGSNVLHNDFGYTGEMWDEESNLLYLRARYYDPSIGRFLTKDDFLGNVNNPLSLNRYTYVLNNPLLFTDPWGLLPIKKGDTGIEVELTQRMLTNIGYSCPITGTFDQATLDQVNLFKGRNSLGNTKPGEAGVVGNQTFGTLADQWWKWWAPQHTFYKEIDKSQMNNVIGLLNERIAYDEKWAHYMSYTDDVIGIVPEVGTIAKYYNKLTIEQLPEFEKNELVQARNILQQYYNSPNITTIEVWSETGYFNFTMHIGDQSFTMINAGYLEWYINTGLPLRGQ